MSEQTESRNQGGGLVGAVILIGLGVAFLLNNMGILSVNWLGLLRFWPVLLILVGLDVLLGRRSLIGQLILAVLGLAIVIGVIYLASGTAVSADAITRPISQPLGEVEELDVTLQLGAFATNITTLSDSNMAVSGDYTTDPQLELSVDYDDSGSTGKLEISQEDDMVFPLPGNGNFSGELNLGLTDNIPVKLEVNAGAGDLDLDLTGLNLTSLDLNLGAGQLTLLLPEQGDFDVSVGGGVGDIQVTVPDSLDARIDIDSAIVGRTIDNRFEKRDDSLWQSSGYDGADNRVKLEIDAAVGNIVVR